MGAVVRGLAAPTVAGDGGASVPSGNAVKTSSDSVDTTIIETNVREHKSPTKRSIGGYRSCSSSNRWLVCILLAFAGIG